jgi:hypothetical protein
MIPYRKIFEVDCRTTKSIVLTAESEEQALELAKKALESLPTLFITWTDCAVWEAREI